MSATSKLVGFSATAEQDIDEAGQRVDLERRRYLMRYVVGALGVAGLICVAAGVRVAMARSAPAQDDSIPTLSSHPISLSPQPAAPSAQAEPAPAPVPAAPVAAAPVAVAPVAAAPVAPPPPAAATPVAATPVPAAGSRSSAKPLASPAANAAPAHARAAAAAPHPQAHASAIIQSAPF
jgi:hypothetical protein